MAVLEVQKASFPFIVVGLVEEVPQISQEDSTIIEAVPARIQPPKPLTQQFLQRFLSILKGN